MKWNLLYLLPILSSFFLQAGSRELSAQELEVVRRAWVKNTGKPIVLTQGVVLYAKFYVDGKEKVLACEHQSDIAGAQAVMVKYQVARPEWYYTKNS